MSSPDLTLRYYGDPILREKAKPIEEITDEIRALAKAMIEIMIQKNGIGLAAPQVGVSLRMFVSNVLHEDRAGEVHTGPPRVFINPILSNPSSASVERSEGCLSIPKLYAPVLRPFSITIEASDLEGRRFTEHPEAYVARCMMHETDHLDGILFTDHVKGRRRSEMEAYLRTIKMRFQKKS